MAKMYKVRLDSIKCIKHSSGLGNDDLYFRITTDSKEFRVPNGPATYNSWDINEGTTVPLQKESNLQNGAKVLGTELIFTFYQSATVAVWDYDWGSGDDHLGTCSIKTTDGQHKALLKDKDEESQYELVYSVKVVDDDW